MQAAIAEAHQTECAANRYSEACLLDYWANLIMIRALQHWHGSLPVCVFAANFVTAKWSAINGTTVSDRLFKLFTHLDKELVTVACSAVLHCDLSESQLL